MARKLWGPADYTKQETRAIQALFDYADGVTDVAPGPAQTKLALDWIVYSAAALREEPFLAPGQQDVRDYVLGRQSVARQILKLRSLIVEKVFNE